MKKKITTIGYILEFLVKVLTVMNCVFYIHTFFRSLLVVLEAHRICWPPAFGVEYPVMRTSRICTSDCPQTALRIHSGRDIITAILTHFLCITATNRTFLKLRHHLHVNDRRLSGAINVGLPKMKYNHIIIL